MENNLSSFDMKKTLKTGAIYLLIAFPFVLIVSTILTIVNIPHWLNMLISVVVGAVVVFICYIVHNKIKQKRKENSENEFDPFKD